MRGSVQERVVQALKISVLVLKLAMESRISRQTHHEAHVVPVVGGTFHESVKKVLLGCVPNQYLIVMSDNRVVRNGDCEDTLASRLTQCSNLVHPVVVTKNMDAWENNAHEGWAKPYRMRRACADLRNF